MTQPTISPTADPPYDTWLTKAEAAAAIGVTTKAIEGLMKQQRLRFLNDYLRHRRRVTIFHPHDVAEYAEKRRRRLTLPPVVLPAAATNGDGPSDESQALVPTWGELEKRMVAIVRKVVPPPASQQTSQRPEISDQLLLAKVFLTIHEAARLTGLSEANIRRRCQSGSLKAIKDGGWKIRRARLQKL
jgi:excisionase family DNA binding protein